MKKIPVSVRLLSGFLIACVLLCSCVSIEQRAKAAARSLALKAAQPLLEKVFFAEAPILPSSRTVYPTVPKLPGEFFNPISNIGKPLQQTASGKLLLQPGDYAIPVMTFCMKSSASSPAAHLYRLASIAGKNADIIRALHSRAYPKFSANDVQVLSWAIQAGTAYEKLGVTGKKIVDSVLPEFRNRLKTPFLDSFAQKWDAVSRAVPQLPPFAAVTEDVLNELGVVGEAVQRMRKYRETVQRHGHDYETLRTLVELPGASRQKGDSTTTPWSIIAPRVYARFITEGSFQHPGRLEVRVVPAGQTASTSPVGFFHLAELFLEPPAFAEPRILTAAEVESGAVQGDPGTPTIQPLALAAMAAGFAANRQLGAMLAAALLAAMLAQAWPAIYEGIEKGSKPGYEDAKETVEDASQMVASAKDALEEGARETGLIDDTCKDTTTNPNNPTRQYDKPGGSQQQTKDWDNLPYPEVAAGDGTKTKTAPDGTTYVNRPTPSRTSPPTIEIQPPPVNGTRPPTRIKIRYPQ